MYSNTYRFTIITHPPLLHIFLPMPLHFFTPNQKMLIWLQWWSSKNRLRRKLEKVGRCFRSTHGFFLPAWYFTWLKASRALLPLTIFTREYLGFYLTYTTSKSSWLSNISILDISSSRLGQTSFAVLKDLGNTLNSSSMWLAVSAQKGKAGLRMYRRFFDLRLRRKGSSCLPRLRRYRSWICYREILFSSFIPSKIDTASWQPIMNVCRSHGPSSPCLLLLVHLLKEVLRKNAIKSPVVKKKAKETYENGLSEDDRAKIKEIMFTSRNMELNSSQERFLQSTIDLGFPKAGAFAVFSYNGFIPWTSASSRNRIPTENG